MSRFRKTEDDQGFTLIELLVVIIIIGILAAIAIPVFLNQRQRGWEAAVQADLRNAATAQETFLTENSVYVQAGVDIADGTINSDPSTDLDDVGFKYSDGGNYDGGTADIVVATADEGLEYCMEATANGGTMFSYSSPGGLVEGACATP